LKAVTITLDGVEVSGYEGMTILDLAREAGVDIPTMCHDDHLAPNGACRLCLVEEEHSVPLLPACITEIRPGMVINTHSPRVKEHRKVIIQLMLTSHPDSCLVCDKGNRCQLRKLAAELGIGLVDYKKIAQYSTIEEVNPFIVRDLSKCILCAKCIRADQELVVEGAIDYINRGFSSKPATLNNVPLEKSECTFCGTCVALCPTGALMEKEMAFRGTTNEIVESICPFCGCGCGIRLEIKDNRIISARPSTTSPVNNGALCVRGSYGYDFIHSPERLTSPLVKVNGTFQEVSWEQAIERVAFEFKRIKEEHSPDCLAVFGSSKCTNEDNYILQRFTRIALGTNNIDNGSRLYNAPSRVALGWSIGFAGTTGSLAELEKSDVILVIGANPAVSAPVVGYAIKRAVKYKRAKLIFVDPQKSKLAPFAHQWLKLKAGTDIALIDGLAKIIIDEKLFDEEYVTRKTENFTELIMSLKDYSIEHVEKITEIHGRDLELAARLFAGAERASIVYGNGITQQCNGTDNVLALANLAMLTGNTGRSGGGIFALQRENNAQGACDMGSLPDFLPGYQCLDDGKARKSFAERWGNNLPIKTGFSVCEMIQQAEIGNIKGMFIVGENPLASFPSPHSVSKALSSLQFMAVADIFLTETAKLAAVVLPAASFAEKEGTFTNFEGRAQRMNRAIKPPGQCLPEWEMVQRLSNQMGYPMPYSSPQQIRDEIEDLVPFYQNLDDADVEMEKRNLAIPNSKRLGEKRLYKGPFPSGFERFSPVQYTPLNTYENEYPLTLLTGSILYQFGSGTRTMRTSRMKKFSNQAWVDINEADAYRLGFSDGDTVKVVSSAGEVTTNIKVTNTLPSRTLFMPISFADCRVNELFGLALDPKAKSPALKRCPVRLERI
jgi:formate dehydrogenase alpha subunit